MRGCGETGKIKQKGLRPRMWDLGWPWERIDFLLTLRLYRKTQKKKNDK